MEYIYDITLSLIPSGYIPVVNVKQGDASTRFIRAKIEAKDGPYYPGAEQTILFREEKPDGTCVLTDNSSIDTELERYLVTVDEDGAVVIELTAQMLSCAGYCRCDLCFVRNGKILSSSPFVIDVESSPDGGGRATSTDDFRSLVNALGRVWASGVTAIPGVVSSGTLTLGPNWTGDGPYTTTVMPSGYTPTNNTAVNILNDADVIAQMSRDGVYNLYIINDGGTLTAVAVGGMPSVTLTVPVVYIETDTASYEDVQDGQVIAYDGTREIWTNQSLSAYGFLTEADVQQIVSTYGYQTSTQVTQLIQEYIQGLDGNNTEY